MVNVALVIIITLSVFIIIEAGFIIWLIVKLVRALKTDMALFIDKDKRFRLSPQNFTGKNTFEYKKKKYFLKSECALLNKRGKALYIFGEGKPAPLKIEYNKSEWIDSESLMSIINNKLLQKLVQPAESLKDTFMLLGAIGGLVAGVSSIIVLVKVFGLLDTVTP